MIDPIEIEGILPIPGIDRPSDQTIISLHYEHLIAVLQYNILLELKAHTVILAQHTTLLTEIKDLG